jgi:uncharacterized repeat protein (TIGR03847 family)
MMSNSFELKPVTSITTGAIGPPGKRVFYLQARKDDELISLIVEKIQVQSLAIGVHRFLEELAKAKPELPAASAVYKESEMSLEEPIDPAFRVAQIGLGYDDEADLMVVVAREFPSEEDEPEEGSIARFWTTRSQLLAMSQLGLEVANRGRPICGNCGEPIDSDGHFCPKRNGHKH